MESERVDEMVLSVAPFPSFLSSGECVKPNVTFTVA